MVRYALQRRAVCSTSREHRCQSIGSHDTCELIDDEHRPLNQSREASPRSTCNRPMTSVLTRRLSLLFQNVRLSEIGDVVILDVDENELRTPFRDLESLPADLVSFSLINE